VLPIFLRGSPLERPDLDVTWLPDASWLMAWEVAREGRLLDELSACARLHNRLVHQYADVALPALFLTLERSVASWRRYVGEVQGRLDPQPEEES